MSANVGTDPADALYAGSGQQTVSGGAGDDVRSECFRRGCDPDYRVERIRLDQFSGIEGDGKNGQS